VNITGGTLRNSEQGRRRFEGVSIDSRSVGSGQLFIALPGRRVDGHDYIAQALERGAVAVMAERSSSRLSAISTDAPLVLVEQSHAAMIRLAERYRDMVTARRIGITGSNGKTTTKEITYSLISAVEENSYRSPGNLNNLYGAPLALLAMPQETKVAVLEMGVSLPGEMAKLAGIVKPHLVAITNVGATHLEFLGSIEGVAREKISLLTSSEPQTQLVANADDDILMREAGRVCREFVTFGIRNRATYRPDSIRLERDGSTTVVIESHCFRLSLFGEHQVYNLLAGYAVFRTLGLTFEGVDTSKLEFKTAPMRGQILHSHGVMFVVDCYNANPASVALGLKSFDAYATGGRRIVILGDMLELGADAVAYHRAMGRQAAEYRFDAVVFVGPLSREAYEAALGAGRTAANTMHFPDARSCARETAALFHVGNAVYVKGSRGIGLETVVQPWQVKEETV
jgi:UDP-N-acetylmuramoyl-tripeptide--D-alanyl-D-alanine ligase